MTRSGGRPLAFAEAPTGGLAAGRHVHDRLFYDRPPEERPYAEVIGNPIEHSKSPLIHRFWIEKLGMTADYKTLQLDAGELKAYLAERIPDKRWRGCNVTMPLKIAVIDHIPLLASRGETPSVNTIFRHRLDVAVGTTTDMAGFWQPLGRLIEATGFPLWAAPVQVVGAGGAARAVVAALTKRGIRDLRIYNRAVETARELARSFGIDESRALPLEALRPVPPADMPAMNPHGLHLIVNASSLGMAGRPSPPIDFTEYPAGSLAYDLVYQPAETAFLREARANGLIGLDGLEMLVEQARQSFSLFFSRRPPGEHDRELWKMLRS